MGSGFFFKFYLQNSRLDIMYERFLTLDKQKYNEASINCNSL